MIHFSCGLMCHSKIAAAICLRVCSGSICSFCVHGIWMGCGCRMHIWMQCIVEMLSGCDCIALIVMCACLSGVWVGFWIVWVLCCKL